MFRDGIVAALPRRHRNVPRLWCLTPQKRRGRRDKRYNDRGGLGKACFPAPRGVDGGTCQIPQEADARAVPSFHVRPAVLRRGVRSLQQRKLLGGPLPGQNTALSRSDPLSFRSLRDRRRRSGRKTLVQPSVFGDLHVRRHATWGMSA